MTEKQMRTSTRGILVRAGALALTSLAVLLAGTATPAQIRKAAEMTRNAGKGGARLVAAAPLAIPHAAGASMSQWEPASASSSGYVGAVAFLPQMDAGSIPAEKREEVRKRPPYRMVKDPYASFSAVAVDPVRDEVVMTDESLFQILIYDRMTNTPPNASMSEPKRMLGGLTTKIDYVCGLYIDPVSGDIYGVNNDTVDTLVIFDRNAKGNVPPTRELYTPHGTYGIVMDEQEKEMFLTIQHDAAVVVFDKYAVKDDEPKRYLQGDDTQLADPHGIALDEKRGLIFVTNFGSKHTHDAKLNNESRPMYSRGEGKKNWPLTRNSAIPGSGRFLPASITVHRKSDSGNARPLRLISGPKAGLNWPTGLAFDSEKNELYVTNDMTHEILVFDGDASGDVAPKRKLGGPKTMIRNPTGVWVDARNQELWVASFGNYTATVFPLNAAGDQAPKRVVRSGPLGRQALMIGNPHPVAYDSKREQVLVPNCVAHPQIAMFARDADENSTAVRKIEGQQTRLGRTMHSIIYDPLHDEITVTQDFGNAIMTFRGDASGDQPPKRIIQGPRTMLNGPERHTTDYVNNEIFVPQGDEIIVFNREDAGNVAPKRIFKGPDTKLGADALAVDPTRNLLVVVGPYPKEPLKIRFYPRTAEGNTKPIREMGGPKSLMTRLGGPFALIPSSGKIVLTVRPSESGVLGGDESFTGVWNITDQGDVPPQWTIGGPKGVLMMPRGVAIDEKNKNIIVTDKRLNAILTFHFPEIF